MADELDDILDDQPADPAPDPAPDDKPATVTLSQEQLDVLTASARNAETLAGQVSELTGRMQELTQRFTPQPGAGDGEPDNSQFFADPRAAVRAEIARAVKEHIDPMADRFSGNLAGSTIDSFRRDKKEDPLWVGVEPLFEKEMSKMNKSWLGRLDNTQLADVLTTAYKVAVGDYVMEERKKKAKVKATNLGAGGAGGGSGKSKTLQDLDPVAYRIAVENKFTQEEMDELAKDVLESVKREEE